MSDATVICVYLGLFTALVSAAVRVIADAVLWVLLDVPWSSRARYMSGAVDNGVGAFFITVCILAWAGK